MSRAGSSFASAMRRAQAVGAHGLIERIAARMYRATGARVLLFNLDLRELLTDVPAHLPLPQRRPVRGRPLSIGWVATPPAPGSGGHTTLFRMVTALENQGHQCSIYLYDRHHLDIARQTRNLRAHWPEVAADVHDVTAGIAGCDAVIATSWESAHLVVRHAREPLRRLYFIQDYEPYFYPRGSEYELADMTYRLPFRRIVLGEMLDGMLRTATSAESDVVPFGCDTSAYSPPAAGADARRGVVFFSRPGFARRGYELGCAALAEFQRAHPDQPIHVYGERPRGLAVRHTFHGVLRATELNALYGQSIAGLALSFTNLTLVAEEMLAAGSIPIVNRHPLARSVLTSPYVRWAEPTAHALAAALGAAVSHSDVSGQAREAAASVAGASWTPTQNAFVRIVEEEVYG